MYSRISPTPASVWDHSFFADEQVYLEQRLKLQPEMEQLTPVPDDELQKAADVLVAVLSSPLTFYQPAGTSF